CLQSGAFIAYLLGRPAEAIARIQSGQSALQQAPFQPALLQLENLTLLGMSYTSLRRMREALATFKEAFEFSRTQGLESTQSAGGVLFRWAQALVNFGRPLEAEPILNDYIQIARRGRAELLNSPILWSVHGSVLETLGRLDEAASYAKRLRAQQQSDR